MRATKLILFFSLFCATQIHGFPYDKSHFKEVTIADGIIRGKLLTTHKNNDFYAFEDIPYAQPPIGTLRLKEALPPLKWEGVLNTLEDSKICHQFNLNYSAPKENEDCLHLNVYYPADQNDGELLSVLVWIHGGGFVGWSGAIDSFGPHYFIDKKIVVVTVNYRLGPLGFLSTDDGVVPANLGLKDQNLALKWVQQNIASFGGDPSKVTISGQSAGAASVGYHVLNKKSQGLFRAAIMQSGSPLTCWALHKNARHVAQALGNALSPTNQKNLTSQEILHLVKTADIEQLKQETFKLQVKKYLEPNFGNCHPMTSILMSVVKEEEHYENPFVTGMNHEKLKNGDITQVPILIGINSLESLFFNIPGLLLQTSLIDVNVSLSITANINMRDENKSEAGNELKNLYTNSSFVSSQSGSINYMSDCLFTTPIARHAFLQSRYTDVYFYQFSYYGILGRYEFNDIKGASGVGHQEELGYFWHNATADNLNRFPKEDILTHERVMDLWSQFIKHLNPTVNNSEILGDLKWPKVTEEDFLYLDINSELSVKRGPKKYTDWNNIYSKYTNEKLDTY
ncbi:unnamed protein product [Psylliodes chrysocephalus]|uniref:Carboxylic ester hydrolase n=1 Tax=Psylliodes chrysocephalus TaxID=3402493 RepID=A0A9P0CFT9_9CUCU|nr:unnamed protein product [Psylliodes chrysocephala]